MKDFVVVFKFTPGMRVRYVETGVEGIVDGLMVDRGGQLWCDVVFAESGTPSSKWVRQELLESVGA